MDLKNKIIGIFLGLIMILPFPVLSADPDKLNMVFVPASEKGDNQDYESLIAIIETLADIKIKPIRVTDYNAAVESMRAGRAHIAWYGGKTYIEPLRWLTRKHSLPVSVKGTIPPVTTRILSYLLIAR